MGEDAHSSRYVLAKKIARGGMAEIYLGKIVGEDGFQRLCAIKRILPHYVGEREFIEMFRDEAHIGKRLQHANIVRVEGFEEVEGSYAIIMEFVDGADLRTLLHSVEQSKKRVPTAMACFIIAEAARGLHYAHTKVDEITQQPLGIVHRDISPQNVLVSYEGEVKVTDFGIADAESKLTETRPGIVKGKYSYMSPEQISAKPVDARTDVFALSIVLWEMLSMRRLFQGENEVDTIQRVKNCRIEHELRVLNPEIDEDLDAIVKKGLAKDPKKRYRSAGEFEKDLRRYMSKRHPGFSPADLGEFLKKHMEARRSESAAEIKKTLTETSQKPSKKKKLLEEKKKEDEGWEPAAESPFAASQPPPKQEPPKPDPKPEPQQQQQHADPRGAGGGAVDLEVNRDQPALQLARPGQTGFNRPGQMSPGPLARPSGPGLRDTGYNSRPIPNQPQSTWGVGMRRAPQSSKIWMLGVAAAVALSLMVVWIKNPAHSGNETYLQIRTQPPRVKVMIDNKPINQGRYVFNPPKDDKSKRPPPKIKLTPGTHMLTIIRPGYQTYRAEIDLESGDTYVKDDIVLREKSPRAAIRIFSKGETKALKIDVNDGYYMATMTPGTYVSPDMFPGKTYALKITAVGEKTSFTCKVTPKSTNWRAANEVLIDRRTKKCTMSGGQ